LPIWVCKKCESVKVIGSASELPQKLADFHRPYIDEVVFNCTNSKCSGKMERIKDVLDVWFDSGLAGWASLGYPKNKKLFNDLWPCDFQTEGPDQIRGWWNSELITSVITFDRAPFTNILFHGFVLDAHGIKMSKSKGNIVDPFDAVKKYGRDVLRYYLLSSAPWDDFYFNLTEIEEISKSFNVIENTFNFVKSYATKTEKPKKLNIEDKWMLSRLNSLVESFTKNFQAYNGHKAAAELYDFILNDFSRWYIKLIRDRVWPSYEGKDKAAAMYTLYEVSRNVVRLLAPITPFLAEHVYQNVLKPLGEKKESVHLCDWPQER
jgi:isoleucyl-tRNA synthetase